MRLSYTLLLFALLSYSFNTYAQKSIKAERATSAPKIDAKLDDECWQGTPTFEGNFIQNTPVNGANSPFTSKVFIRYDDDALYIGALLYDTQPDSIAKELDVRDSYGINADYFGISIDPYNNRRNAFDFAVSSAGVQADAIRSENFIDENWNAVWRSKVKITDEGWVVEIIIPYSALRFPKQEIQEWAFNMYRRSARLNMESNWAHIDNSINGSINQYGMLKGISNIKPPVRLSVTPYMSSSYSVNTYTQSKGGNIGGGMDLKYGINESFTLDVSLVPDFSQVQSDNVVLNLSPFEVYFNDFRPFFTEGTEIFGKMGLFYSRRVGSTQYYQGDLAEGEYLTESPSEASLINASKISGRTKKGLGIGIFNAVTNKSYGTVYNSLTDESRTVQVDPLTNYNVLVFDQSLKNNSSVTLVNTNVMRVGHSRDANVTGVETVLYDKNRTYNFRLSTIMSHQFDYNSESQDTETTSGFKYNVNTGKISGKWQYNWSQTLETDQYDINDLGFQTRANSFNNNVAVSYNIFQPFWKLLSFRAFWRTNYQMLYKPFAYAEFRTVTGINATTKGFWNFGIDVSTNPWDVHNYFEARQPGQVFIKEGGYATLNWYFSTDNRKKLRLNMWTGVFRRPNWKQTDQWSGMDLRYRLSNRFSVSLNSSYSKRRNEIGYLIGSESVSELDGDINFGKREVVNASNTLNMKFTFTNRMNLNVRMRHYWSWVDYFDYYTLGADGRVIENDYDGLYPVGHDLAGQDRFDTNLNAFNIDFVYRWQFSPGSELNFVWKNAIFNYDDTIDYYYLSNLNNTIQSPQINTFTLKVLYYLDYVNVRRYIKNK